MLSEFVLLQEAVVTEEFLVEVESFLKNEQIDEALVPNKKSATQQKYGQDIIVLFHQLFYYINVDFFQVVEFVSIICFC